LRRQLARRLIALTNLEILTRLTSSQAFHAGWTNRSGSSKRICRRKEIADCGLRILEILQLRSSQFVISDCRLRFKKIRNPQSAILLFPAPFKVGELSWIDTEVFNFDCLVAFEFYPRGGDQTSFHFAVIFNIKLDVSERVIHRPRAAS
jgi:hypothetical protein